MFAYLSAQVGLVDDRIYPQLLPQNPTYPCIVYRRESSQFNTIFNRQTEFVGADFEIDCFSETYFEAILTGRAARDALKNHSGLMGAVTVKRTFVENEVDIYETNPGVYRRSFNLTIWHYET